MKIRHEHQYPADNFTRVPNELITDHRITLEARLIFIYLLRCKSGFDVNRESIAKVLGTSVHVVRTRLNELATHGYVKNASRRQSDGTYKHELVTHLPVVENPPVDDPVVDSQPVVTSGRSTTSGLSTGGQATRYKKTTSKKTNRTKKTVTRKKVRPSTGNPSMAKKRKRSIRAHYGVASSAPRSSSNGKGTVPATAINVLSYIEGNEGEGLDSLRKYFKDTEDVSLGKSIDYLVKTQRISSEDNCYFTTTSKRN